MKIKHEKIKVSMLQIELFLQLLFPLVYIFVLLFKWLS